jgi:cytochrome c oxidase assembly factor CtaG
VFSVWDLLTGWVIDPVPTAGVLVTGGLYLAAARKSAAGFPRARAGAFCVGLAVVLVALDGPPDVYADTSFTAHMVQHLLLQMVAAPLLVLGAPITVLLRADPPWLPRRRLVGVLRSPAARVLTNPIVTLGAFVVVLVASHLTPLYELALENAAVHAAEHVVYLVVALLLWWTAIGPDPAPRRLTPPGRLLYVFLAMPPMAFLGVAIANAEQVMYRHYALNPPPWGWTPLHDQQVAGTLMWEAGMFTFVPAAGYLLLRWLDEDTRRQDRRESQRRSHPAT